MLIFAAAKSLKLCVDNSLVVGKYRYAIRSPTTKLSLNSTEKIEKSAITCNDACKETRIHLYIMQVFVEKIETSSSGTSNFNVIISFTLYRFILERLGVRKTISKLFWFC